MIRKIATEFKTFALRGNVVDLAVGVIVGGAFGQIVTSLVNDVIMPPIGRLLGGVDFKDLFWRIGPAKDPTKVHAPITTLADAKTAAIPVIAYGQFINTVINFIIIAVCVFFMIKLLNSFSRKKKTEEAVAAPTTKECPYCLSVIPLAASRCAHCTSDLASNAGQASVRG